MLWLKFSPVSFQAEIQTPKLTFSVAPEYLHQETLKNNLSGSKYKSITVFWTNNCFTIASRDRICRSFTIVQRGVSTPQPIDAKLPLPGGCVHALILRT